MSSIADSRRALACLAERFRGADRTGPLRHVLVHSDRYPENHELQGGEDGPSRYGPDLDGLYSVLPVDDPALAHSGTSAECRWAPGHPFRLHHFYGAAHRPFLDDAGRAADHLLRLGVPDHPCMSPAPDLAQHRPFWWIRIVYELAWTDAMSFRAPWVLVVDSGLSYLQQGRPPQSLSGLEWRLPSIVPPGAAVPDWYYAALNLDIRAASAEALAWILVRPAPEAIAPDPERPRARRAGRKRRALTADENRFLITWNTTEYTSYYDCLNAMGLIGRVSVRRAGQIIHADRGRRARAAEKGGGAAKRTRGD
jgi:hypothetical protein